MQKVIRIYKPRPDGYVRCLLDDGSIVYQHRFIMELILGRKLKRSEIIHHKGARSDNRPHKLEFFSNQKSHFVRHTLPRIQILCHQCGTYFPLKLCELKNRKKQGSTLHFCSRLCFETNLKGKPFSGTPHRWPIGHKFTNRISRKRTRLAQWITLTCQFCGDSFDVQPHDKDRKFCSLPCSQKGRDFSTLKGKVNPPESFIKGWITRKRNLQLSTLS